VAPRLNPRNLTGDYIFSFGNNAQPSPFMPDPAKPVPFGLELFKDRLQNILLPSYFLHKSIRRIFIEGESFSLSESAVHIGRDLLDPL
jgi:hypothetical protein